MTTTAAIEEDVALVAPHDDRHRRAGALLRAAGHARRARGGCSRGRATEGLAVEAIGLGSNLLVARRRRRRARAPARRRARRGARRGRRRSSRAAARRTPSACTARATPGSAASSSPRAIPGTAGGGVRMNAGAYGERLARGARRARSWSTPTARATALGRRARALVPALGARARPGRRAGRFRLEPRPVDEIKATVAELLGAAQGDAADARSARSAACSRTRPASPAPAR